MAVFKAERDLSMASAICNRLNILSVDADSPLIFTMVRLEKGGVEAFRFRRNIACTSKGKRQWRKDGFATERQIYDLLKADNGRDACWQWSMALLKCLNAEEVK